MDEASEFVEIPLAAQAIRMLLEIKGHRRCYQKLISYPHLQLKVFVCLTLNKRTPYVLCRWLKAWSAQAIPGQVQVGLGGLGGGS